MSEWLTHEMKEQLVKTTPNASIGESTGLIGDGLEIGESGVFLWKCF